MLYWETNKQTVEKHHGIQCIDGNRDQPVVPSQISSRFPLQRRYGRIDTVLHLITDSFQLATITTTSPFHITHFGGSRSSLLHSTGGHERSSVSVGYSEEGDGGENSLHFFVSSLVSNIFCIVCVALLLYDTRMNWLGCVCRVLLCLLQARRNYYGKLVAYGFPLSYVDSWSKSLAEASYVEFRRLSAIGHVEAVSLVLGLITRTILRHSACIRLLGLHYYKFIHTLIR